MTRPPIIATPFTKMNSRALRAQTALNVAPLVSLDQDQKLDPLDLIQNVTLTVVENPYDHKLVSQQHLGVTDFTWLLLGDCTAHTENKDSHSAATCPTCLAATDQVGCGFARLFEQGYVHLLPVPSPDTSAYKHGLLIENPMLNHDLEDPEFVLQMYVFRSAVTPLALRVRLVGMDVPMEFIVMIDKDSPAVHPPNLEGSSITLGAYQPRYHMEDPSSGGVIHKTVSSLFGTATLDSVHNASVSFNKALPRVVTSLESMDDHAHSVASNMHHISHDSKHIRGVVDATKATVDQTSAEILSAFNEVGDRVGTVEEAVTGLLPKLQAWLQTTQSQIGRATTVTVAVSVFIGIIYALREVYKHIDFQKWKKTVIAVGSALCFMGMGLAFYSGAGAMLLRYAKDLGNTWSKCKDASRPSPTPIPLSGLAVYESRPAFCYAPHARFAFHLVKDAVKATLSTLNAFRIAATHVLWADTEGFNEQEVLLLKTFCDYKRGTINNDQLAAIIVEKKLDTRDVIALLERATPTTKLCFTERVGIDIVDMKVATTEEASRMWDAFTIMQKRLLLRVVDLPSGLAGTLRHWVASNTAQLAQRLESQIANRQHELPSHHKFCQIPKGEEPLLGKEQDRGYVPAPLPAAEPASTVTAQYGMSDPTPELVPTYHNGDLVNKDGPNSLYAVALAVIKKYQNPHIDAWTTFSELRNDSNKMKVALSAADYLAQVVPDALRLSAYKHFGWGAPTDCTQEERDIISEAYAINSFMIDPDTWTRPNRLHWERCHGALSELVTSAKFLSKTGQYTKRLASEVYKLMQSSSATIMGIADTNGFRVPTVGIWLSGDAGIGKSRFADHFVRRFSGGYPAQMRSYTRDPSEGFWNGYAGQFAVQIDDVGSCPPNEQKNSFTSGLLTLLSSKECNVDMAALADKGRRFTSHLLIMTSNRPPEDIIALWSHGNQCTNPEAVRRRFNGTNGIAAEVLLQEEYYVLNENGHRVADEAKITAEAEANPGQFRWLRFRVNGRVYEYEAFCMLYANIYAGALMRYKNLCEAKDLNPDHDYIAKGLVLLRDQCNIDKCIINDFPNYVPEYHMQSRNRRDLDRAHKDGKVDKATYDRELALIAKKKKKKSSTANRFSVLANAVSNAWNEGPPVPRKPTWRPVENKHARDPPPTEATPPRRARIKLQQGQRAGSKNVVIPTAKPTKSRKTQDGRQQKKKEPVPKAIVLVQPSPTLNKAITSAHVKATEVPSVPSELELVEAKGPKPRLVPVTPVLDQDGREVVEEDFPVANLSANLQVEGLCDKTRRAQSWDHLVKHMDSYINSIANIPWYNIAKAVTAASLLVGAVFGAWTWLSNRKDQEPKGHSIEEGDNNNGVPSYRNSTRYGNRVRVKAELHSAQDTGDIALSGLVTRATKNAATITFGPTWDSKNAHRILGLGGTCFLMNVHYLRGHTDGDQVAVRVQDNTYHNKLHLKDVYFFKNNDRKTDMCVWQMRRADHTGAWMPAMRNMANHFVSNKDLQSSYIIASNSRHHLSMLFAEKTRPRFMPIRTARRQVSKYKTLLDHDGNKLHVPHSIHMSGGDWGKGDCGGLLIYKHKIIGVHYMGLHTEGQKNAEHGIAQVLTSEDIAAFWEQHNYGRFEFMDNRDYFPKGSDLSEAGNMTGLPVGDFVYEGSLPFSAAHPNRTTKYRTSGLAECGSVWAAKCDRIPVPLCPSHPRYKGTAKLKSQMLADGLQKYNAATSGVKDDAINRLVMSACVSKLFTAVKPEASRKPVVYTPIEALNPVIVGASLSPFQLSTGAGLSYKGPGKHAHISFDEELGMYVPTDELLHDVEELRKRPPQNLNYRSFYTDTFKDEPREAGKQPRSISSPNLDELILTKMYWGAFMSAFRVSNFSWGHALGLDVLALDWDLLTSRLAEVGTKGFDGDFAKFDSTMSPWFMTMFFEAADKWYKDNGEWSQADSRIREATIYNMCFSKHVCGRTVSTKLRGLPSGSLLTTVMNCFWSKTLLLYSFAILAQKHATHRHWSELHNAHVRTFVLGDDNVSTVSPEVPWYNAANVGSVLAELGIKYTPATKGEALSEELTPLNDLSFLSLTSRESFLPGVTRLPVAKDSSLARCLNWRRDTGAMSWHDAVSSNIHDTLTRAFPSGRERYEEIYDDVIPAFRKLFPDSNDTFATFNERILDWLPVGTSDTKWIESYHMFAQEAPSVHAVTADERPDDSGIVLGIGSNSHREQKYMVKSVMSTKELTRRNYRIWSDSQALLNKWATVSSIFGRGKQSWQELTPFDKLSKFYVGWGGPISFTAIGPDLNMAFYPFLHHAPFFDGLHSLPSTGVTSCPNAMSVDASSRGFVQGIVPFTTTKNFLLIPHYDSMITDAEMPNVNTGVIQVNQKETKTDMAVMAHMPDGAGFLLRYALPLIRYGASNIRPDTYPSPVYHGITASKTVNNLTNVQATGLEMNQTNSSESAMDVDAKANMDAPNLAVTQASVLNNPGPHIASATRVDFAPTLAINSDLEYVDRSTSGTDGAEESLYDLCRPTYWTTFRWSAQNEEGDILAQFPVSCCAAAITEAPSLGDVTLLPAIDTVSSMFSAWSGDLVYQLHFISALMTTGRLGVAWTPAALTPPTSLIDLTGIQYAVIALKGDTISRIVVKWLSETKVKRTYNGQADPIRDCATGFLSFFVLARLRTPDICPNSIDVNISYGAGANFKLHIPWAVNNTLTYEYEQAVPVRDKDEKVAKVEQRSETGQMYSTSGQGLVLPPSTWRGKTTPVVRETNVLIDDASSEASDVVFVEGKAYKPVLHMDTPEAKGPEKIGVTFAEEESPVQSGYMADSKVNTTASVVSQPFISFQDFLNRFQWIANFEWSINDPVSEILYDRPLPFGVSANTNQRVLDAFRLFKPAVEIRLQIQATAMHQGCLAIGAAFGPPIDDMRRTFFGIGSAHPNLPYRIAQSYMDHTFGGAATSTSVTFKVPYRHIQPLMRKEERYANLFIWVFNRLAVGTGGDAEASCALYARYVDTDCRVIEPL